MGILGSWLVTKCMMVLFTEMWITMPGICLGGSNNIFGTTKLCVRVIQCRFQMIAECKPGSRRKVWVKVAFIISQMVSTFIGMVEINWERVHMSKKKVLRTQLVKGKQRKRRMHRVYTHMVVPEKHALRSVTFSLYQELSKLWMLEKNRREVLSCDLTRYLGQVLQRKSHI